MLLKYFYDNYLAQASYLVGCQVCHEALVIDPARDIASYLQAAQDAGLHITHVTETHLHADFVSGARELTAATGARLFLSDMGDSNWKYAFADSNTVLLRDGDSFMVGNVRVDVIHTPGHTPEHLIFQVTDTHGADQPMGLFTGDCLFVGDVGRPDLLDEVAGFSGTRETGALGQFRNIQFLKTLPDYLQIWPGHGAGSACGKQLGAVPTSTLGYEKLFNPAFQIAHEQQFVEWLLADQPEAPRYFAQMKRVNKAGPALLTTLPAPVRLAADRLDSVLASALVIDTRRMGDFARQHAPRSVNIPASSYSFNTYAGWYVDFGAPTYLIAGESDLPRIVMLLRAIGVDNIPGYFTPDVVQAYQGQVVKISPEQAEAMRRAGSAYLLDVRNADEFRDGHIPGAAHIPMGYVPERAHELPQDRPLVIHCASGVRSQIVISLLQRQGFTNALNLIGGLDGWKQAGLPVE
jgi:hydroxyacylglutathione hydrolase